MEFISREMQGRTSKNRNVVIVLFRAEYFPIVKHPIISTPQKYTHNPKFLNQEEVPVSSKIAQSPNTLKVWANLERISLRKQQQIFMTPKMIKEKQHQRKNKDNQLVSSLRVSSKLKNCIIEW